MAKDFEIGGGQSKHRIKLTIKLKMIKFEGI
jgi:hypothetical protein